MFDGRQLDRWGLREDRLPPGSRVLFREPTLWTEHRGAVVATVLALLVQAALIAALVVQARHRRRAQQRLRELSGRLLDVQETERSRISRELHDDVNQRLALLAIQLDGLGGGAPRPAAELRQGALGLADQVRGLSHDVHRIARELHPPVLDQLGLVAALRQFASDVGSVRPGLEIEVTAAEWPARLPRALELAFYRITQEALQNVVKHSGARSAKVALRGTAKELSLTVTDSGCGFDAGSRQPGRLGLAGMEERLRLLGGQLTVQSPPDGGTVVVAVVPGDALELTRLEERLAHSRALGGNRQDVRGS
jgi:signal transduction histidine kinase